MSLLRFISSRLSPTVFNNNRRIFQVLRFVQSKHGATELENDEDKPIPFTKSSASTWKASSSRSGEISERLWYEPYVIITSLAVFLLYFCVLREENDIDQELGRSLYSRIDGLEEHQLRQVLRYNIQNGLPTSEIENRLKEIQKN